MITNNDQRHTMKKNISNFPSNKQELKLDITSCAFQRGFGQGDGIHVRQPPQLSLNRRKRDEKSKINTAHDHCLSYQHNR